MTAEEKAISLSMANIEKLLFEDYKAWKSMPEMKRFRDQWSISKMSPSLRPTGLAAMVDFLSSAGPEQEKALSEYFGRAVTIDNYDRRCVANMEFEADLPPDMNDMSAYTGFGCFRRGSKVYVTFWR